MQNVKTTVTTGGGGLAGRRAWSGGWIYRLNSSSTEHMQNRAPSQTRTLAVKSFLKVEKELKHFYSHQNYTV